MKELTFILLERIGLLLIIAFVLIRIPSFKTLLYRENDLKTTLMHSLLFGLFGVISSHFGLIFVSGVILDEIFVLSVEDDYMLISLSLIAVVIAGILGGPKVGLGAGFTAGIRLMSHWGSGLCAALLVRAITWGLACLT